jgi:sugar phosphate isomerase/epimerase
VPELNLGISLASLRQPFKKALHTAARLGARGVEIDIRNTLRPNELSDTGLRQLRKMMEDLDLRVVAVRFQTRRGYDVLDGLDRRLEATKEAMKFAYRLGAGVVINAIGTVPEQLVAAKDTTKDAAAKHNDPLPPAVEGPMSGFDLSHLGKSRDVYSQFQACLNDLARYGQHVGAMLACETGTEPAGRLAKLLDSLPEQAIGINFNPGNLIINDSYSEDSIRQSASRVISVTARDGVQDRSRGRGLEVPIGRGSAEFPQILGVLEEHNYRGWFLLERQQSDDPETELANGISFLKSL